MLEKLLSRVFKPVKKIVSSDVGKAALLGAGIYGLGGGSFFGRQLPGLAQGAKFGLSNLKPNIMNYLVGQASRQMGLH